MVTSQQEFTTRTFFVNLKSILSLSLSERISVDDLTFGVTDGRGSASVSVSQTSTRQIRISVVVVVTISE